MVINTAMRGQTLYNIGRTFKRIREEGIRSLTFWDWLWLGLDIAHIVPATTWAAMTTRWKTQARAFHNLGERLAQTVGRTRSSVAGRLGVRMAVRT